MENAFKSDFSPQDERGEELTARNEKSQQRANMEATGQSIEELQGKLDKAILVRDKALSFIVAIRREKEFFQHIGLTCTPDFEQRVEKQMQEMADLYLRQQEVYKIMEGRK